MCILVLKGYITQDIHSLFPCALQGMVWLPLPGADQDRFRELNVLPPGPAHWQQEGAHRGEAGEPGGGGDGQCQSSGHSGGVSLLYGSEFKPVPYCSVDLISPFYAHPGPIIVLGA